MRFSGAETSKIAAMPQSRMWEPHHTPQLQRTSSFRYHILRFNFFIQFVFNNKQISEGCTYKFAPSLRKPAMGCSHSGFVLYVPVDKGGCEGNERSSTRIKHIFRKQHWLCEGIQEKQTQPNLLEHTSFIWCDTGHRNLLSVRAFSYLLYYERSENGMEPNITKKH